jgi:diguanylate cyclase (GGDEF)-like protein/PAS domain S-box-containing protein
MSSLSSTIVRPTRIQGRFKPVDIVGMSPVRHRWRGYLALGSFACLLYLVAPPLRGSAILYGLIGLSPCVAMLVALRSRPRHGEADWRTPWAWFAAGMALFWCGDAYLHAYPLVTHHAAPFPSVGDGATVLGYPALMAGLLMLGRRRTQRPGFGGTIDAAILTLGLALPSWVSFIAPYLHDGALTTLARAVSVAYPMGDVLLLAAAVQLALDAGRRTPAFYLLTSSIVLLLISDFVYGMLILHGDYHHQLWLDAGWIGFYLLWGAASLHPSLPLLAEPGERRGPVLTRFRLSLLTGASLMAPAIGLVQDLGNGDVDYAVVRVTSLLLFALVITRMAGLLRQHERSFARERMLSEAGSALVAATTLEAIHGVAAEAARGLAGPELSVLVCAADERGAVDVVSTSRPLRVDASVALALGKVAAAGGRSPVEPARLGLPAAHDRGVVVHIPALRARQGLIIVAGASEPPRDLHEALRTLANQVALAIDREDLTDEVHRQRSEARFGSLVKHSSDLITVVGSDGVISYQSPSIARVLGWSPDEVIGESVGELVAGPDRDRLLKVLGEAATAAEGETGSFECRLRHRDDDELRQFEVRYTNLTGDEHVHGIVLNSRDVSERRAFEEQLAHQAFHDPVTGLANRALFVERVRHALTRGRREGRGMAVIFLDLDDFKTINDSLGHAAGDEVLVEVSKRLATSIRASDTAARFGGDEFALLLEDIEHRDEAIETAERIIEALKTPVRAATKELTVRCSAGISVVNGEAAAFADEVIRDADAAMYIAKHDGKGGYRLFEPHMHKGAMARLELRADLQLAEPASQLELLYQPIVHLDDSSVSGVEALLRWHHPIRGTIQPDQFIPLAEDTGLIVSVGRWVLREGCRQARRMRDELGPDAPVTMSVNVSLKQLQDDGIVDDVRSALAEAGVPPQALTLEITESVLMADTELAVERLNELKGLGVRLALDDFGTGYSSLSYLSRFPVDVLKMDRSFLRDGATPEARGLAKAVLALGATLELDVVAEGIELTDQWRTLHGLGCPLGQGFLFGHPMSADQSLAFIAQNLAEREATAAAA